MARDRPVEHRIVSEALDDVATVGEGLIVAFHYESGKKAALPEELKRQILALEATVKK